MKKLLLAATLATSSAVAAINDERLVAVENGMSYLKQRVKAQDRVIEDKNVTTSKLESSSSGAGGWFQSVSVGSVVELEANRTSTSGTASTSDIVLPTIALGVNVKVNDWVGAELVLLYEEGTNNNGQLNIDTAAISIADPNSSWFLKGGQFTLPFGTYSTNMISDPITLDLGETGDTAIELGAGNENFSASAFIFQGDNETKIKNFGITLNASANHINGHIGYISNLGESDGIVDGGWVTDGNKSAAWIASADATFGDITVIVEYLAATEAFADSGNQKPSVFNIEGAFAVDIMGKPATVALAYQGSDDASHTNWGLAKKRIVGAVTVEVTDGTSFAVEYKTEEDYAGIGTDTVTGRLAVEF